MGFLCGFTKNNRNFSSFLKNFQVVSILILVIILNPVYSIPQFTNHGYPGAQMPSLFGNIPIFRNIFGNPQNQNQAPGNRNNNYLNQPNQQQQPYYSSQPSNSYPFSQFPTNQNSPFGNNDLFNNIFGINQPTQGNQQQNTGNTQQTVVPNNQNDNRQPSGNQYSQNTYPTENGWWKNNGGQQKFGQNWPTQGNQHPYSQGPIDSYNNGQLTKPNQETILPETLNKGQGSGGLNNQIPSTNQNSRNPTTLINQNPQYSSGNQIPNQVTNQIPSTNQNPNQLTYQIQNQPTNQNQIPSTNKIPNQSNYQIQNQPTNKIPNQSTNQINPNPNKHQMTPPLNQVKPTYQISPQSQIKDTLTNQLPTAPTQDSKILPTNQESFQDPPVINQPTQRQPDYQEDIRNENNPNQGNTNNVVSIPNKIQPNQPNQLSQPNQPNQDGKIQDEKSPLPTNNGPAQQNSEQNKSTSGDENEEYDYLDYDKLMDSIGSKDTTDEPLKPKSTNQKAAQPPMKIDARDNTVLNNPINFS